jgi:dipeptidyl aminopeptidase/acylaminoacyl peptidase
MTARKKAGLVLGALAMVASGMAASSSPAGAAFPGINGKIACSSNRTGNFEVFLFNPDATESGATNITNHPGNDGRPRWRSDGRKIAFESNRAGGTNIFIADADGSNVQQLTFTNDASSPAWHPDGSQIVYQRNIPGLFFEVYKINIDGTGTTPLASHPAEDSLPFWNPDGTIIAFNSRRTDPAADIHLMDSFGTNVSGPLGVPGVEDSWPNWSPDGSQLAFHSRRDDPNGEEIYRMPSTGGPATRLTFNPGPVQPSFDIFPAWSPDGNRIVWNSGRAAGPDGFGEIYTMNASDGSGIVRITNSPAIDQRCDWQPLCTIYGSGDIVGTAGNDIICGSEGDDRIAGLGGADIVYGFGGNDQLSGGDGVDRMFGGIGNDSFVGGPGADFTSGGPGADRFSGETVDRIDVGAGPGDLCVLNGAAATCPPRLS